LGPFEGSTPGSNYPSQFAPGAADYAMELMRPPTPEQIERQRALILATNAFEAAERPQLLN
jgi:hypothetical protein